MSDTIIIYPEYFDIELSRLEGRRIPKNLAIKGPSLDMLIQSCENLKLTIVIERDKSFPRFWYNKKGRIIIKEPSKKKEKILKEIAKAIRKSNSSE